MIQHSIQLIVIGAIYFYQNWQFFNYAESVLAKPVKKQQVVLAFAVNYLLFTAVSLLQLHLTINWLLIFTLLFAEILFFFRCSARDGFILALIAMIMGLALNVLFRCLISIVTDTPLTAFSNASRDAANLKSYPVGLGFLLSGFYFHAARYTEEHTSSVRIIFQDPARKRFLIQLSIAIYLYLVLNLLIYSIPDNSLMLKLWGIKSCVFSLLGLYLSIIYAARISRLNQYRRLNRQVREDLRSRRLEELDLHRIASIDPLTNCLNRQSAERDLNTVWSLGQPFCLCFIDLNNLKEVNDTLGHDMGDLYLLTVVQTLKNIFSHCEDTLYRYGGDEFLLILKSMTACEADSRILTVNRSLTARSQTQEHPFVMAVCHGSVESSEARDIPALLTKADQKMYLEKKKALKTN